MNIIDFEVIENKIIEIRNEKVLLDNDVASLYGVETKRASYSPKQSKANQNKNR
ncbi:MAG TPA: hypothetical protein DD381_08805 [Lentisphaeria bacterium]|nr:hypothetical protein [Lentisphaeria bacterium]